MPTLTFPAGYNPAYSFAHTKSVRSFVTTFENGKEQRAYVMTAPREWEVTFIDTPTRIKTLMTFWDTTKGNVQSFSWTPPTQSTAVTVRFKDNELKVDCSGNHVWKFTCILREVL